MTDFVDLFLKHSSVAVNIYKVEKCTQTLNYSN